MTPAERAQRIAEAARERETPRHDRWRIDRNGDVIELVLTEPQPFDWVAERYPGAAITRC